MLIMGIGGFICLAALGVGGYVFWVFRELRIARESLILTDASLYAQGAQAANKKAASKKKRTTQDTKLDIKLHEAGLNLSALNWILLIIACAVLAAAVVYFLTKNVAIALVPLPVVYLISNLYLSSRSTKRRHLFNVQLARALPQIAAGIRSSFTLERAIRVTTAHLEDPLRDEFQKVSADAAYSTSLTEAITRMAKRTQNKHIKKLATAVTIQEHKGGPIAPSLDMIAEGVNADLAAERELRQEKASMSLTKWVVIAALPLFLLLKWATDLSFVQFYTTQPLGWLVLGIAGVIEVVGILIAQKITRV